MPLDRFKEAQSESSEGYEQALRELRSTGKQSHWIWYIFPQLEGLGGSAQSRYYAIADLAEATQYLKDPVLGPRLLAAGLAVVEQLRGGTSLLSLMNSSTDVRKLVSSMTLFAGVAERIAHDDEMLTRLSAVAKEILAAAAAQKFAPCRLTAEYLATTRAG